MSYFKDYQHLRQRVKYSVFIPYTFKRYLLDMERNDALAKKVEKFLNTYNWEKLPPSIWIDIYEVLICTSEGEKVSKNINLNLDKLSNDV